MRNALLSLVAGVFASSMSLAAVTGSISFSGVAPKAEVIKMGDPNCLKGHEGQKVMKEDIVVGANKGLANVFVYVKEGVKKETVPPAPTTPVKFDQSVCHYTPHVVGVRVGQPFQIHNSDDTMHNVHSTSKANSGFNMGMTKGQVVEKKFTKPETMIKVKCDVHGWMTAYVGVVDHPYFAVSDTSGAFTIDGLADGEYTFEAIHEKLGTKTAKATVAGGVAKVDFAF